MGLAEIDRATIARCKREILAMAAAAPDRADGMNHMPRRQTVCQSDFGVAGLAAMQRAAFGEQLRPGRTMDSAINAAAAEQRTIRGVDDGVDAERRDIRDGDVESRRTELARRQTQAEAAAPTVTPLSASSCCSSPAWNISRIMSQPPTNSPLT